MANVREYFPWVLKKEGGYCNVKHDRGGATNMGVTIGVWKKYGYDKDHDGDIDENDLKIVTPADVLDRIMIPLYWNRWHADQIKSQSVANMLVDWVWASGKYGIIFPQRMLGVVADGVVGPQTLAMVNRQNPREFFNRLKARRIKHFEDIVKADPTQAKFLKGWINRVNSLTFTS